ncbi:par-5 [Symbiodinium sp. CCMP2456]|nr:par-5 [Symbiodinium sp. CCMP2456]
MGVGISQSCCQGESQRVVCDLDHSSSLSLLYLDKEIEDDLTSTRGSSDASSRASHAGQTGKLRGVPVLRVQAAMPVLAKASGLDRTGIEELQNVLRSHGVDTTSWGSHGTKSIEHLFWELFIQHGSILTGIGTTRLKRVTRLLKLRLVADIDGVDHVVLSRLQFMHDGQQIQRQQLPLRRLAWKLPTDSPLLPSCEANVYNEDYEYVESWRSCCMSVLEERLGISMTTAQQQLKEVANTYTYQNDDNVASEGYPGLTTLYGVHQVTFRVVNPDHSKVAGIGLPLGQEFATADGHFSLERFHCKEPIPIGSQLNVWFWMPCTEFDKACAGQSLPRSDCGESPSIGRLEAELTFLKRVPVAPAISKTASMNPGVAGKEANMTKRGAPNAHLRRILANKRTDWKTVRKMANRIMDKDYTLAQFTQDLAAFPELSLYLRDGVGETGSGRTTDDEYQRTVCAFFAIYWLMRLDTDGRQGFCFGTDIDWNVLKESALQEGQVAVQTRTVSPELQQRFYKVDRRLAFFNNAQWGFFRRLMVDAGLLQETSAGSRTAYKVQETRMGLREALTAIHDIMKMENLLPTVQQEHHGYHGYAAGDVIGDHDTALCYILDHYTELLPSFKELDPAERQSVQFTQCNLCFNHGWLVQAEAPPGAIFTKFREAIAKDRRLHAGARDVALYFVHWLTDLAGAEPTPLGGCEKFVIKFPLHVLNSFLQSFKLIEGITSATETQVMERYLKYRWTDHVPSLKEAPEGPHAIAAMRLLCMAQAAGKLLFDVGDASSIGSATDSRRFASPRSNAAVHYSSAHRLGLQLQIIHSAIPERSCAGGAVGSFCEQESRDSAGVSRQMGERWWMPSTSSCHRRTSWKRSGGISEVGTCSYSPHLAGLVALHNMYTSNVVGATWSAGPGKLLNSAGAGQGGLECGNGTNGLCRRFRPRSSCSRETSIQNRTLFMSTPHSASTARPVLHSNLGAEGGPVETGLRPNFHPFPARAWRRLEHKCCVGCTA